MSKRPNGHSANKCHFGGIGWVFRKSYPTKIPGMVQQGLLAPQRLSRRRGHGGKIDAYGLFCDLIPDFAAFILSSLSSSVFFSALAVRLHLLRVSVAAKGNPTF